jgi:hypothetical protein
MIIKKFAQGGQSSLPPLVAYKPLIMNDTDATSAPSTDTTPLKSSSKSSEADLTNKDILSMLKTELDGLPNDV